MRLTDVEVAGEDLTVAGGRLYFVGDLQERGEELGVTDGTVEGTRVLDLARPVVSSDPHRLIAGRGGLVFLADDGEYGTDLWRSGGHRWDTEQLADLVPGYTYTDYVWLAPGSGGAFYSTYPDRRFGWTDGRTSQDLVSPGAVAWPMGFVDLGERTLFFSSRPVSATDWQPWIWSSDGTPDGTAPVAAAADFVGDLFHLQSAAVRAPQSDEVRFLVQKVPYYPERLSKLSTTDGTAAGTRELVGIPVRRRIDYLYDLAAAGPFVFVSFWSDHRAALWVSDGTAAGTREVYALSGSYGSAFITWLTAVGDQVLFVGDDLERGCELWASDGTPEGTRRVADLAPGAASSSPSDLAAFGSRVLFSADDGRHGRELWVSDGTAEGTRLLEIQPGPRGSYPQDFQVVGDRVVFAADDGVHGLEVWVTDGTPEGTRLAADVMAGPRASSPQGFTVYGDELFFNAGRPREGYELWKLPLAALAP